MPSQRDQSYHAARHAYGLISGVLLAWEFVGIGFSPTPIPAVGITIKSPIAIPYVLLVMVVYFGLRFCIEVDQLDTKRRSLASVRADIWMAHIIGVVAIGVFLGDALFAIKAFRAVTAGPSALSVPGALVTALVVVVWWRSFGWRQRAFGIMTAVGVPTLAWWAWRKFGLRGVIWLLGGGLVSTTLILVFFAFIYGGALKRMQD